MLEFLKQSWWFLYNSRLTMKALKCPFLTRVSMTQISQNARSLLANHVGSCPVMGRVISTAQVAVLEVDGAGMFIYTYIGDFKEWWKHFGKFKITEAESGTCVFSSWSLNYCLDRVKQIWYLSPMRAAKVQASLRICAVSPEPSLLAHTSSESRGTLRQKARSLAPLNDWACTIKSCHDGMLEDINSLDGARLWASSGNMQG